MIILMIVCVTLGWICGVWLPWWVIGMILIIKAIGALRGVFDGGLESIPLIIGSGAFTATMIVVGFAFGDTTLSDIGIAIKYLFTGI